MNSVKKERPGLNPSTYSKEANKRLQETGKPMKKALEPESQRSISILPNESIEAQQFPATQIAHRQNDPDSIMSRHFGGWKTPHETPF